MRTVTLELLRHGPAHNQLLSPLTPYLALCENHAPVTLNVPFEHNQFLHRLAALTYEFGTSDLAENQRRFQLQDTGRELSKLLCSIPGLTAELSRLGQESGSGTGEMIHLRLVLSASELALLPFELVLAGNGFPGFGQPLLLQSQTPLCLTREVRRVKEAAGPWPAEAKVLFVWAQPPGLEPVPVQAHLLALRRAVAPWVPYFDESDPDARRAAVSQCLHVLSEASITAIQEECARGGYTHVHVLAHGLMRREGYDERFGIALHDSANPQAAPDIVSGERLASALRPLVRPDRNGLVRPIVVTLASCHGAAQGSVVGAGASVAHALHEAGISLVVAGQFPLTFEGSVELVQTLYGGLLWGLDPRTLLMDLRRRLHAAQPRSHDWAALTAYASLPEDAGYALPLARAQLALQAAMEHADQVVVQRMQHGGDGDGNSDSLEADRAAMDAANARIEQPLKAFEKLVDCVPVERAFEMRGMLASLYKRLAETEQLFSLLLPDENPARKMHQAKSMELLGNSRDSYGQCFREHRDSAWAGVQYLCLSLVLDPLPEMSGEAQVDAPPRQHAELTRLWELCHQLSMDDLNRPGESAGWALGNLIELALLARLLDLPRLQKKRWEKEAQTYTEELLRRAEHHFPDQLRSTKRQLERYWYWFGQLNKRFGKVEEVAAALRQRFTDD